MRFMMSLSLYPPGARLVLAGELDAFVGADLGRGLDEALATGCQHVTIDASEISFVDAGGLGSLLRLRNAARQRGGSVEVGAASETFRRVAVLAGLGAAFAPVSSSTAGARPGGMTR